MGYCLWRYLHPLVRLWTLWQGPSAVSLRAQHCISHLASAQGCLLDLSSRLEWDRGMPWCQVFHSQGSLVRHEVSCTSPTHINTGSRTMCPDGKCVLHNGPPSQFSPTQSSTQKAVKTCDLKLFQLCDSLIPTLWGKSTWGLQTSLGRSNISIRSQLTSSLLETIRCTLAARARPGPSLSFFQTHILFPGPGMHLSITTLCPFLLGSLRCLLKCHLLCCCRKKVHGTRNFDRLFKVCL